MAKAEYVTRIEKQNMSNKIVKDAVGYSIRVQTTAAVYNHSFSGVVVVLGFSYLCSVLLKEILMFFIDNKKLVAQQGNPSLDVEAHVKSD